jgi:predicted alpha/beta superfamily hydrolase
MKIYSEKLRFEHINLDLNIWVGVPRNKGPYKVLVMHDGQNLFKDEWASYNTAWKVDKALALCGLDDVLVVGIECPDGWRRVSVYSPFIIDYPEVVEHGVKGGEGGAYIKDIIETVMPYIEKNYPILKGPENTAMMGASMGGVISLYAGFEHPEIFGRIASLSGAYYVSIQAYLDYLKGPLKNVPTHFYLDVGDQEEGLSTKTMYVDVHQAIDQALEPYKHQMHYQSKIIEGGVHNERAWEQRLPVILPFLWAQ